MKPWTPFERVQLTPATPAEVAEMARHAGVPYADALKADLETVRDEVWVNSRYQVNVRRGNAPECGDYRMIWLSIKRRDKRPPGEERFRDFQRIKNELVGPEFEAVEIYPAESRMMDTANQYHLWVFPTPGVQIPFGFAVRAVVGESGAGAVQKPFED